MSADELENESRSAKAAVPPVALRKMWVSQFNGGNDDDGGVFDLTRLRDNGDAVDCTHGGNPISGGVQELDIPEAPAARFRVQLNRRLQGTSVRLQYRGIAIHNPDTGAINKIIGFERIIRPSVVPRGNVPGFEQDNALELLSQEEGTWVATQP